MHVISLYLTTKSRQCKLGYDSSPQCDSFQLGEMTRFFSRIGSLRPQSIIYPSGTSLNPEPHQGNISDLITAMRQCPSYQIDRNHAHCGIRTRLIPALDPIQGLIATEAGICRSCWRDDRGVYRWGENEEVRVWSPENGWAGTNGNTSDRKGSQKVLEVEEKGRAKGRSKEKSIREQGNRRSTCRALHRQARALFTAETRDWDAVS